MRQLHYIIIFSHVIYIFKGEAPLAVTPMVTIRTRLHLHGNIVYMK